MFCEFRCVLILTNILIIGVNGNYTYTGWQQYEYKSVPLSSVLHKQFFKLYSSVKNESLLVYRDNTTLLSGYMINRNFSVSGNNAGFVIRARNSKSGVFYLNNVHLERNCTDVYSTKLFEKNSCKLPKICFGGDIVELTYTWYGSKMFLCYGHTKKYEFKNKEVNFLYYSNWDFNDFRKYFEWVFQNDIRLGSDIYQDKYLKLISIDSYYKIVPKIMWDEFSTNRPYDFLKINKNWYQVGLSQRNRTMLYASLTSLIDFKHESKNRVPYIFPIYNATFKFLCVNDSARLDWNYWSRARDENVYISKVCNEFIEYNDTHKICAWAFDLSLDANKICPIYFYPIRGSIDRITLDVMVRTSNYTWYEDVVFSFQSVISDAIQAFLDVLVVQVEGFLKYLLPVVEKFLENIIELLISAIKELFTNKLLGDLEELIGTISQLLEKFLKLIIRMIIDLDKRIHIFELILLYVLLVYITNSKLSGILLTILIFTFLGLERYYVSVYEYYFNNYSYVERDEL